jgi:pSer/pThr/pTyr-binding forkhead associated (FHA) protein
MRGFRLEVVEGEGAGRCLDDVGDEPLTIGRAATNRFVLGDPAVSKRHAVIEPTPRGYLLRDLGSLNGTKRDGNAIAREGILLTDGDQLTLGRTVLRFSLPAGSAPASPDRRVEPSGSASPPEPDRRVSPPLPRRRPDGAEEEAGEAFGPYRVLRALDSDGRVRVDLAADPRTGARVALQRTPASRFGFFGVRRFLRSCDAARTLDHPNLVAPLAAGREGGSVWVASPYVAGPTVEAIVNDCPRDLTIALAVHIARDVAGALGYLEGQPGATQRPRVTDRQVVVTPAGRAVLLNVGVLPDDADPRAFGARYRSPEEDAGRKPDQRAAVFSLGVLLYELLVQEPIDASQKARLRGVDAVRIEVPTSLAEIVMRAVEVRPEDRFDRAADLEAALGEELHALDPPYGAAQVAAWLRRRYPEAATS